jgi:hypothetical protein
MYRTLYTREGIIVEEVLEDGPDQDILFWTD